MVSKRPTVLVVDDDVDTCGNLLDILTELGYDVSTANDGPRAIDLVQRDVFDLALLDFNMPGMNGLSVYREIKRLSPATAAIIVTAYLNSETSTEARQAGMLEVLAKPVDLSRLLPLVEQAISQPLVLIVDDDHDLCASLWDVLHERGCRVGMAHSAVEARDRLQERPYAVVLLDLKLPESNAEQVFHAIRQTMPGTRTILITGYPREFESLVAQALAEGADAVCYKPLDLPQLFQTLQQFIPEAPQVS